MVCGVLSASFDHGPPPTEPADAVGVTGGEEPRATGGAVDDVGRAGEHPEQDIGMVGNGAVGATRGGPDGNEVDPGGLLGLGESEVEPGDVVGGRSGEIGDVPDRAAGVPTVGPPLVVEQELERPGRSRRLGGRGRLRCDRGRAGHSVSGPESGHVEHEVGRIGSEGGDASVAHGRDGVVGNGLSAARRVHRRGGGPGARCGPQGHVAGGSGLGDGGIAGNGGHVGRRQTAAILDVDVRHGAGRDLGERTAFGRVRRTGVEHPVRVDGSEQPGRGLGSGIAGVVADDVDDELRGGEGEHVETCAVEGCVDLVGEGLTRPGRVEVRRRRPG